jgi:hypothetical protein
MTPQKRRRHLIDKHMYPPNFFFAITRDGVDGRRSMLLEGGHRRRRSSTDIKHSRRNSLVGPAKAKQQSAPSVKPEGAKEKPLEDGPDFDMVDKASGSPDVEMDDLAGAMSSLRFVPRSIRFGRGGRAGFAKS